MRQIRDCSRFVQEQSRILGGKFDDPDGIRTRVAALKGPCPRPLDDGAAVDKPMTGLAFKHGQLLAACLGEGNTMQSFGGASMGLLRRSQKQAA